MLVAGNWKMNTDLPEATTLAREVVERVGEVADVQVVLCPPFVSLDAVFAALRGSRVRLGAQTMHAEDSGAFTGEISAGMLRSVGCDYVILGHSERRQLFGESDASVREKVVQALANDLIPIVCVGETLDMRRAGNEASVVEQQVRGSLEGVPLDDAERLVLAYEPVWAIGTGETATPEQAQAMHAHIRNLMQSLYGSVGRDVQVLYGGSVKPDNAVDLFGRPDVDGGLIGGASLKAAAFTAIVEAARSIG